MKDQFFKEIEKATLAGFMKWEASPLVKGEYIAEIPPGIFLQDGRCEYKEFVLCTFTPTEAKKEFSDNIKLGKLASRLQISNKKGETDGLVVVMSKSLVKKRRYGPEPYERIVEDRDFIDLLFLIHDCINGRMTLTQLRMKIHKDLLQGHKQK